MTKDEMTSKQLEQVEQMSTGEAVKPVAKPLVSTAKKHRTENPNINTTSAIIKKIFENFAIYRYSHCQLDRKHLLMNSQMTKGAVIALHALMQNPKVRAFLMKPEDRELYNSERIRMLFLKVI